MAIINVSPADNISALIASSSVSEGDVIRLEEGVYYQSVIITKNYIRIISEHGRAVFNGRGVLAAGFILINVTGVEIFGVNIQNYLVAGVYISGGSANRILCNKICDITVNGIYCTASTANLIWKNCIRNVNDGILLQNGSTNNWVIENDIRKCKDDGIESFLSIDQNNAMVGNCICDCGDNCMEVFGANNFVYHNESSGGNTGELITSGSNTVSIENKCCHNNYGFFVNAQNAFLSRNESVGNNETGIQCGLGFGILQGNLAAGNKNSGLVLTQYSRNNLVYNNRVVCNTPSNLVNDGTGNNLLHNRSGCEHGRFDNEDISV